MKRSVSPSRRSVPAAGALLYAIVWLVGTVNDRLSHRSGKKTEEDGLSPAHRLLPGVLGASEDCANSASTFWLAWSDDRVPVQRNRAQVPHETGHEVPFEIAHEVLLKQREVGDVSS